jgi:hypothetical protein
MVKMTPPIVVIEGQDASVHDSVADAERQLEAVDVRSGGFTAYDADGRLLRLETAWATRPAFFGLLGANTEVVRIKAAEAEPRHQDDLRAALMASLAAAGSNPGSLARLTSGELIQTLRDAANRR